MKAKPTTFAVAYLRLSRRTCPDRKTYVIELNEFEALDWMDVIADHEGVLYDSSQFNYELFVMLEFNILPMLKGGYRPIRKTDIWRCDVYEVG